MEFLGRNIVIVNALLLNSGGRNVILTGRERSSPVQEKASTSLPAPLTAPGATGIIGQPALSLVVEEKELEVDFATELDMEERNVKEIRRKKRTATFISVQLTVIGILTMPGATVPRSAGEEPGRDCGLVFNPNLKGKSVREVIKKRRTATLGPVQLTVCGVSGLSGVAATDHVEVDMNPDSGHVPHHNMEAIIVWETLGREGPAIPIPVNPSRLLLVLRTSLDKLVKQSEI